MDTHVPTSTGGSSASPKGKGKTHEIQPHEKLYYADGDIVLLSLPVEGVITAFKVDKVFLKRASSVFEDMLTLPAVEDVEKYDGVPLVRLHDQPHHLEQFLFALYDHGTIPFKRLQRDTIQRVEGPLLLATKYEVDTLRNRIIALLEVDWPTTLEEWDGNEAEMKRMLVTLEQAGNGDTLSEHWPEPASCIRLANLCNVPSLLPAAYYDLSRIAFDADINDDDFEEDSLMEPAPIDYDYRSAAFGLLSAKELRHLMYGKRALLRYCICVSFNMITTLLKNHICPVPEAVFLTEDEACGASEAIEAAQIFENKSLAQYGAGGTDPLLILAQYSSTTALCNMAQANLKQEIKQQRRGLWDTIPSIFRLPKATAG
ncbi:hypothetical protein M422DRAFT_241776 [Sphaerobolus stellatus SS14]|nr:hypothetical protein M422DRAFT_241776 [Sphaerobolus stellatus SS14]